VTAVVSHACVQVTLLHLVMLYSARTEMMLAVWTYQRETVTCFLYVKVLNEKKQSYAKVISICSKTESL
jgi:hypothetical protein